MFKTITAIAAALALFACGASAAPKSGKGDAVARRLAEIPWKTPRYSLTARDMDLRTALDTFAVAQGLSIVMSPAVGGAFSGEFKDVPAADFLRKIATVHNLAWYYDGAALYIYGAGETTAMLIDLKYMAAPEVRSMLRDLGVEDERFPIRTTSDGRLIMVSGPPRYVAIVAETVAKADKLREMRTWNEVETRVFPLVHTWADDVSFSVSSPESSVTLRGIAHLLEELVSSDGARTRDSSVSNTTDSAELAAAFSFKPVIRADNRLNAVVVRDVVSRLPTYEKVIRQLDKPAKLVEIGVTVVEMSRKDALDWQLALKVEGGRGHTSGAIGENAGNLFDAAGLGGRGLAGALTYLGKDANVSASLTALREKGKARSISRTSLLTVNNLAAMITDTQSYHARVVGTEVASLQEVSAGTKLNIKPRIVAAPGSAGTDQIWLSLQLDDGGFESVSVDAMPMKRSSSLITQAAVFEDESILLAGYLRDIEEDAGWGIPWLRDIPFIGWLFGGSSTRKETVQRMFILTPHIVDIDSEALVRMQARRLRDTLEMETVLDDAEELDREREIRALKRAAVKEERDLKFKEEKKALVEAAKKAGVYEKILL